MRRASTMGCAPARAARGSSRGPCRRTPSTSAWRTRTAQWTNEEEIAASSAASRSACRRGWCWQVGGNISIMIFTSYQKYLLGTYKIFVAVREDRMPGGRNSGAVYNMYPCKVGAQVNITMVQSILHHSQRILIRGHVNNNLTVVSVCSTSTRNTRRPPACPSRPGC